METIKLILATYMICLLLTSTDGPFDIFVRLRSIKYLRALRCFTCTSVYAAGLLAIIPSKSVYDWLITTLVIAGAATIVDRYMVT